MAGQGPVARAVTAALKAADVQARDQGAVQLAKSYAALIDAASPTSVYAKHLRILSAVLAVLDSDDSKVTEAFTKVSAALSAHSVASDLGPKLLAVLVQLGLTPAARGVKAGLNSMDPHVEPVVPEPKPEGKRDELKQRRDQRARRGTEGTG